MRQPRDRQGLAIRPQKALRDEGESSKLGHQTRNPTKASSHRCRHPSEVFMLHLSFNDVGRRGDSARKSWEFSSRNNFHLGKYARVCGPFPSPMDRQRSVELNDRD